ncbi:MAG TPA: SDR family oxidoreductase [Candidatus Nanoarchaeia archaeon]|nr:SDR family oxidoreductase [Candidatus Nanoarchaeia archaeon]
MKTIFITGASSGIGKACVDLFSSKGWNVAAAMRNPSRELNWPDSVLVLPLDVTNKDSMAPAVQKAEEKFGKIDVLLNNAAFGQVGAIESMSEKQMRNIFETNVFGLMNLTAMILPKMRARNDGLIINVSSVVGQITSPLSGYYCATKHALESISESLWHELSETNVRIKVVEPGFTKTKFHPSNVRGEVKIPLYEGKIEKKIERMANYNNPTPAERVAEVIFKAATDRSRKLRYTIENHIRFQLFLHGILPDFFFLSLINRRYRR